MPGTGQNNKLRMQGGTFTSKTTMQIGWEQAVRHQAKCVLALELSVTQVFFLPRHTK